MRRRDIKIGVVAAAALAFTSSFPLPAQAAHVGCGQVITQSTTLHADVVGCANNGIIIGADNITLNLAGYRVSGTASPLDGAGILAVNRSGVTILSGVVTGFDGGVVIQGGSRNTVRQMVVSGNVGRRNSGHLPNSTYGDGILLLDSSDNQVLSNLVDGNGPLAGIALRGDSDNNLVQGNSSRNNKVPLDGPNIDGALQEDTGFRLERIGNRAPNFNLLQANNASGNGQDGFGIRDGSNDNRLIGNTALSNGFEGPVETGPGSGIRIFDRVYRTLVTGNTSTRNALHGIYIAPTIQFPTPALENQILRNRSVYNDQASPKIIGFDMIDGNVFCDSNVWADNFFFTENFPGSDCIH